MFYSLNGNKPILIGYLCDDDPKKMIPNDNYVELFKDDWVKKFGHADILPIELRFGMYAATKAIVADCRLRELMTKAFGSEKADELLDYAMYSILYPSDTSSQYESRMSDQVLFSGRLYSDSTYSLLFEKGIAEDNITYFRKLWALHCRETGITRVWLCIDGSNEDCRCKGVEIAEKSKVKSEKNTDIVSFAYAVTATGFPVTFKVYRGGLADPKEMKDIIDFLKECGIETEGIILDRGYCDSEAIRYLDENNIQYLIMIKGEPAGYRQAVNETKTVIRNSARHLVRKTHLYAAQKEIQLFSDYKKQDYVTIFCDFLNGAERLRQYLDKIYTEIDRFEELIEKGKNAAVNEAFRDVLSIDPATNAVCMDPSEIQKRIDDTGIYGIVHSEKMTPYEVHQQYSSRCASEKQYSFVKTQLGYGTGAHVHFDAGTKSRFCLGFISSIIRYSMEQAADKVSIAPTSYFRELNLISMLRVNKVFFYTHPEKDKQIQMLAQLGENTEYLDEIVDEINKRMSGQGHRIVKKKPNPKAETPVSEDTEKPIEKPRGKPGPKPGFKRSDTNMDGSKRQKPGPKPGSKKGKFNKDGSIRQKPGPKKGSHHAGTTAQADSPVSSQL